MTYFGAEIGGGLAWRREQAEAANRLRMQSIRVVINPMELSMQLWRRLQVGFPGDGAALLAASDAELLQIPNVGPKLLAEWRRHVPSPGG